VWTDVRRRRGAGVPDDVRAALRTGKGERVLAVAALDGGAWAVATDRRLVVLVPGTEPRVDHGWHEVDTASWEGDSGVLAVRWVSGERTWLTLVDAGDVGLPTVLRERVESTVVAQRRVAVAGRGGARLVVRRIEGRLALQTVLDRGTDPGDPLVAEAVAAGRTELMDLVGPLDDA
jgi:hypothetical protein